MDNFSAEMSYLNQGIVLLRLVVMMSILMGVMITVGVYGCVAEGDSFGVDELDCLWIPENDVLTPFIVLSKTDDYFLVIRKHSTGPCEFSYSNSLKSYYENSALDHFLNVEYAERFRPEIRAFFLESDIEITAEESIGCCGQNTSVIKRVFFEPSWTETTGRHNSTSPKEGEQFSKRFSKLYLAATDDEGEPSFWWLRTPITWGYNRVLSINEEGGVSSGTTIDINGTYLANVRPVFRISIDAPISFEKGLCYLNINTE